MRRRRSHWRSMVGGGIVIAAAFGVALVEHYHAPKGSVWIVVAIAALLVVVVRAVGRNR
jgi:hypothetical protein